MTILDIPFVHFAYESIRCRLNSHHPQLDKPFITNNPSKSASGERRCYTLNINNYHKNKNAIDLDMLRLIKTYLLVRSSFSRVCVPLINEALLYKKYDLSVWYTSTIWKPYNNKNDLVTGADLRAIYESIKNKTPYAKQFFKEQAEAVYAVATTKKPLIPFLRGNVVGLGAAFALNCQVPVATPNTAFSAPGCVYGWTGADSGMSYTLSRLSGYIGEYLALTGKRVCGSDLIHLGLAHFYADSRDIEETLEISLSSVEEHNIHTVLETIHGGTGTSGSCHTSLVERISFELTGFCFCFFWGVSSLEPFALGEFIPAINRCFARDTVEDIMDALRAEKSAWASHVCEVLERHSPLSLKITLKAIRLARQLSRENCLQMEYAIHTRLMHEPDFLLGIEREVFGLSEFEVDAEGLDVEDEPLWDKYMQSAIHDIDGSDEKLDAKLDEELDDELDDELDEEFEKEFENIVIPKKAKEEADEEDEEIDEEYDEEAEYDEDAEDAEYDDEYLVDDGIDWAAQEAGLKALEKQQATTLDSAALAAKRAAKIKENRRAMAQRLLRNKDEIKPKEDESKFERELEGIEGLEIKQLKNLDIERLKADVDEQLKEIEHIDLERLKEKEGFDPEADIDQQLKDFEDFEDLDQPLKANFERLKEMERSEDLEDMILELDNLEPELKEAKRWRQVLSEVTDAQVETFFKPLPEHERLQLVPTRKNTVQYDIQVETDRAFVQDRPTKMVKEAGDYIVANTTPAEREAIFVKGNIDVAMQFLNREISGRPQIATLQEYYHEDLVGFVDDFDEDIPERSKASQS
jgi:enoyl-CoA hydratase/carnithine racemase